MSKKSQSIDGFTLRPNSNVNVSGSRGFVTKRRSIQVNQQPATTPINVVDNPKANLRPHGNYRKDSFDDALASDITSSLNDINAQQAAAAPARRAHQEKAKRKASIGKIVKRVMIALIILLLGVAIYFGIKIYLAGGNVFKGNPISMLTTKTRLNEDENGRTNILIFGTSGYTMDPDAWDGAMLTDSIMVLSVDQDGDDAYMMSLPRDLYVKYTTSTGASRLGKLNEVYSQNNPQNNNEEQGARALMSKAGSILGLDIQYYVHADWTALLQAVDAVGGVDVTIESTDPRGIYDSGTKLRYKNGEVAHLNGEKALALARARNHNPGDYGLAAGNYDREKNQQKILAALRTKIMSTGTLLNVTAMDGLINAMGNNLVTSFEAGHVQTLIDLTKGMSVDKIKQLPFVGRGDGQPDLIAGYTVGGQYKGEAPVAGVFDYSDIQQYIADNLSSDPVVKEGATIDVLNGSDTPGLAAKKAEVLEGKHYKIGQTANAPNEVAGEVTIYQRNKDMSGTAKALEQLYGATINQGDLAGYTTDADFIVVFGTEATF